jgi:hypothetical protein
MSIGRENSAEASQFNGTIERDYLSKKRLNFLISRFFCIIMFTFAANEKNLFTAAAGAHASYDDGAEPERP